MTQKVQRGLQPPPSVPTRTGTRSCHRIEYENEKSPREKIPNTGNTNRKSRKCRAIPYAVGVTASEQAATTDSTDDADRKSGECRAFPYAEGVT